MNGLAWSLNEVADNVLLHSGDEPVGWIQAILYPAESAAGFVVVDLGRGIRASLVESFPELVSDAEAIQIAIERGTSRSNEFQGRGLAGLVEIVKACNGKIQIHSGDALMRVAEDGVSLTHVPSHPGTIVSATVPLSNAIDLEAVLWGRPVISFLEDHVWTAEGGMRVAVAEEATNFGNRMTGRALRLRLANLVRDTPTDVVVLDFYNVDLVSSSFADEFVGKLVADLESSDQRPRVEIRNANQLVAGTIEEAVRQRRLQQPSNSGPDA